MFYFADEGDLFWTSNLEMLIVPVGLNDGEEGKLVELGVGWFGSTVWDGVQEKKLAMLKTPGNTALWTMSPVVKDGTNYVVFAGMKFRQAEVPDGGVLRKAIWEIGQKVRIFQPASVGIANLDEGFTWDLQRDLLMGELQGRGIKDSMPIWMWEKIGEEG